MMDIEALLKKYRKKPLATDDELAASGSFSPVSYDRDALMRVLPHRDPFLLVDSVTGVDFCGPESLVRGTRYIDPADPVFRGHFPDYPLYPGCLQVEMTGQLGLCLAFFLKRGEIGIPEDAVPPAVRATKLLGALFLEPLLPGVTATLYARGLTYDGYFGTVLGQVVADGKVCSVSAAEVMFLDE